MPNSGLAENAYELRRLIVEMSAQREGAHLGGSLSVADLLCVLFHRTLRVFPDTPNHPDRDLFILSKGHCAAALYAVLAQRGFLSLSELADYAVNGSRLSGHPSTNIPGVEFATGSLGHGLSLGVGAALGLKRQGRQNRTVVVMGDGELQEGTVWEAAGAAGRLGLGRLLVIVDRNMLQINGPVEQWLPVNAGSLKWRGFGWDVKECDGHDYDAIECAIETAFVNSNVPHVILASTVKGKGLPSYENQLGSHYAALTPSLKRQALAELAANRP